MSFGVYALKAKGMPMRELVRRAEVIRQGLLHVPGVKKINILDERPEQIFVEFSFAKLATLGVSAQNIATALQRQNTVTPAGSIDTRGRRSSFDSTAPMTVCRQSPIPRSSPVGARSGFPMSRRSAVDTKTPRRSSFAMRVSRPSCLPPSCCKDGTAWRWARRFRKEPPRSRRRCR
jgi:multidrug efflux pump subunit AcrB